MGEIGITGLPVVQHWRLRHATGQRISPTSAHLGVLDLTPKSMGLLRVKLPKCVAIQDRPVEAHAQSSKFLSKCEHRSKRRHLVRVSDALPYTNIVHSVVRVVDSD